MNRTTKILEFTTRQLDRLECKDFPPREQRAIDEVVHALVDSCESREHIERTVDVIAGTPGKFPEPAIFREIARQTATLDWKPNPYCEQCAGTGYRSEQLGGVEVQRKCHCPVEPCEICGGTGTYTRIAGGTSAAGRCDCWAMRKREERAPWQAESERIEG